MTREEKLELIVQCADAARRYAEMELGNGRLVVPHNLEYYIVSTMLFPAPTGMQGPTAGNLDMLLKRWREEAGES